MRGCETTNQEFVVRRLLGSCAVLVYSASPRAPSLFPFHSAPSFVVSSAPRHGFQAGKKGFTAQAPRAVALSRAVLTVLQLLSSGSAVGRKAACSDASTTRRQAFDPAALRAKEEPDNKVVEQPVSQLLKALISGDPVELILQAYRSSFTRINFSQVHSQM